MSMNAQDVFRIHHKVDDTATATATCSSDLVSQPLSDVLPSKESLSKGMPQYGGIAVVPPTLSPSESSSKHGKETASRPAGDQVLHAQCFSQQHILAERALTSFRHDRRLKRGEITSGQIVVSPFSTSDSPHFVMDSPACLELPASMMTHTERGATPPLLRDDSHSCKGVFAGSASLTCGCASVMDSTTPQRYSSSSGPAPSIATGAGHSTGAAYQPLSAEDDEGDVEYKWRLTGLSATRFEHLVTQMQFRVSEGHGQCLYELGVSDDGTPRGLTRQEFNESVQNIFRMAAQLQLEATLLQCCVVEGASRNQSTSSAASPNHPSNDTVAVSSESQHHHPGGGHMKSKEELLCGEIMLSRRQAGNGGHDMSIAFCGAVGSGKSTLMAVLLTSRLDDGCGGTRQSLFNHKHELDTGRTSSLSSRVWTVLQEPAEALSAPMGSVGSTELSSPTDFPMATPHNVASTWSFIPSGAPPTPPFTCSSPRSITLLDVGGDITKTMLFGLMSRKPDYVCLCVAADTADVSDVPLYAEICFAMSIPFLVVITKCDLVEEFELDGLIMELAVALDTVGFLAEQVDSLVMAAAYCREWPPRHCTALAEGDDGLAPLEGSTTPALSPLGVEKLPLPVFCVSSVLGGEGLDLFRSCLSHLQRFPSSPPLGPSSSAPKPPFEVLLDSSFAVDGVGHVVHGRVTRGPVEVGCNCYIGPGSDGSFYPVLVRGIHVDGGHVNAAQVGDEATFALHRLPDAVTVSHKGKVLVRKPETVVRSFQATVLVLSQSICAHMEPIIYTRNARQAACVTAVTGAHREEESDVAGAAAGKCERVVVQCRFLFRPEVVTTGDALVLQWAPRGIAVGRFTSLECPAEV